MRLRPGRTRRSGRRQISTSEEQVCARLHRPVTLASSQINTSRIITRNVPISGTPMTTPTPCTRRGVTQGSRRQQTAQQGQRKNAVEEAGMIVGEAAADGLGHQRIDAGVARSDEYRARAAPNQFFVKNRIRQPNSADARCPSAGGRGARGAEWPPRPGGRSSGTASRAPG